MKNKLSRVLVLLLAIAMMIPSFAMAEGEVKLTTTAVAASTVAMEGYGMPYTVLDQDGQPATYTLTDTTGEDYAVTWKSSDTSKVNVRENIGGNAVPELEILDVCENVTITGSTRNKYGETGPSVSFTITATEVKIVEFELPKTSDKAFVGENYDLDEAMPKVTKTDPADKTATYARDWKWEIKSGAEFADMMAYNQLNLKKAGTVELSVSPKGTSTASAQTFTLKIFDEPKPDTEKVGYEKLTFSTKTLEIETDTIYLDGEETNYLEKVMPGDVEKLDYTIDWTSSDESIATVDHGEVSFKQEGTVTITATSHFNPKATDSITVTYKKPVENNYKTIEFVKDSATIDNVGSYEINVTKTLIDENNPKNPDEKMAFCVDEPQLITFVGVGYWGIDGDSSWWFTDDLPVLISWDTDRIHEEKTVTIQVRSYRNKECPVKTFKLTIKPIDEAPKAINVIDTPITLRWTDARDADLTQYVSTEPVGFEKALVFTSNNPDVVKVRDGYHAYVDENCVPGEATITVRAPEYPEVEAKTFKVKYEKEGIQKLAFVNLPGTVKSDLNLGSYLNIEPYYYDVYDADALYWNSSDPQVATVEDGKLKVLQSGTVTITVSDVNGTVSATATIKVDMKAGVKEVSLKDVTLKVNQTLDLVTVSHTEDDFGTVVSGESNFTIVPHDIDFYSLDVSWSSSNREVAEVMKVNLFNEDRDLSSYRLHAYKPGTSIITVVVKDEDVTLTASCTVTVTDTELTGIVLPKNKVTLKLYSKTEGTMRFNYDPIDAHVSAGELYAESGNKAVVDDVELNLGEGKGTVTYVAQAPGKAWISIKRASDDETVAAFKVVVETTKVKRISLPEKTINLNWYDDGLPVQSNRTYQNSYWLVTSVSPENAYYTISYQTTDPSVAFVRDDSALNGGNGAEIVAAGVGTATITVKVDDGFKVRTAKLKVIVNGKAPKLAISQKKATIDMTAGEKTLKLKAYNAETEEKVAVTWTSSNPKVAKVDKKGKVTALAAGKTTITAIHEPSGRKVTCKVTVKSDIKVVDVKKISGDKYVTIKKGEKKTLNIKVKPAGAEVTFTSSDPKIVTVDKNGKIKGKKAGKATIIVSGDGVTFKVKVTVK